MAFDPKAMYDSPAAESYERYVHENWDKLQSWEQQQAQDFLAARRRAETVASGNSNPMRWAHQPFLNEVSDRPRRSGRSDGSWASKCAWACALGTLFSPFIFGPLGVFFGLYNIWKGDQEKGILQVGVVILVFVVMMIMLMASQELTGRLVPGPDYLVS